MKKNIPTIVFGAALSLAMATFTSNAFAQGAGGAGGGAGAGGSGASAGGSGSVGSGASSGASGAESGNMGAGSAAPAAGSVRVRPVRTCRAARESAR